MRLFLHLNTLKHFYGGYFTIVDNSNICVISAFSHSSWDFPASSHDAWFSVMSWIFWELWDSGYYLNPIFYQAPSNTVLQKKKKKKRRISFLLPGGGGSSGPYLASFDTPEGTSILLLLGGCGISRSAPDYLFHHPGGETKKAPHYWVGDRSSGPPQIYSGLNLHCQRGASLFPGRDENQDSLFSLYWWEWGWGSNYLNFSPLLHCPFPGTSARESRLSWGCFLSAPFGILDCQILHHQVQDTWNKKKTQGNHHCVTPQVPRSLTKSLQLIVFV